MNNLNIIHEITFRKGDNALHIIKFKDNEHKIIITKLGISKTLSIDGFKSAYRFIENTLKGW